MGIILEQSKFRIRWDLLILFLIILSCFLIPYQLVFQHNISLKGSIVIYVIDLIFILDILFNFRTSFRRHGNVITNKHEIKKQYIRKLLLVDILASLPFDALFLLSPNIQLFNISIVLILRAMRLLRIVRLFVIFHRLELLNWTNPGYLRILKFLLSIFLLIHWLACGWFLIAFIENFPPDSWVRITNIVSENPVNQYIHSLYWAITTMTTVGFGDITPGRIYEYIFTMIVMLLGASMYAFIIGNIASLFSNLDSTKADYWNRMESVTQYLRDRHLPAEINTKVQDYYEYLWFRHRGLSESTFLNDLPEPLRLEILTHLTKDLLEKVPLFKYSSEQLRRVLLISLKQKIFTPKGYIVHEGSHGDAIYFISRGSAEIITSDSDESVGILDEGDYFGNMSLILREKRSAAVRALDFCEVFILYLEDFNRIKEQYRDLREVMKKMSSDKTDKISDLIQNGIIL